VVDEDNINQATPANVATLGKIEHGWRGLVWQLKAMQGTRLIEEITATAQRGLARGRYPHFLRMAGSTLTPQAPVTLQELIPGARIRLDLDPEQWLRPVNTPLRLTDVEVSFDPDGETVQITCEPVSVNVENPADLTDQDDDHDAQEVMGGAR